VFWPAQAHNTEKTKLGLAEQIALRAMEPIRLEFAKKNALLFHGLMKTQTGFVFFDALVEKVQIMNHEHAPHLAAVDTETITQGFALRNALLAHMQRQSPLDYALESALLGNMLKIRLGHVKVLARQAMEKILQEYAWQSAHSKHGLTQYQIVFVF